ncbi:MAG: hypothetical protein COV74_03830 [Candidatus Omnitrophica bacterium CG11_big_fil_rev_8_21_14_0_20_45_26]|uniref:Transcriptional regulator n=1 Tax=Candidatus Abzuiibacterium crystallinum TaxID=1974748 RepID=A0A2H0LT80_9BACT|nr:MAG: hypothetical protein COV74_03830 [Candidatus Omnitrophica bacterium CG11_big_fil_rev_8_21_14_0_20_45_26]PIW65605.1 MAG: hypothetical protein COW12_01005 [Candidatus Omnitrophica bacterium CG12_big_fil_rev_8_21_14_0_65_45_16]
MRFTTKTEYGLFCLIFMAQTKNGVDPITVKDIVKGENYSQAYTEKILQSLRMANILKSHHGQQGGYVLARPAAEITLREIIEALEGQTFDVFCQPEFRKDIVCNHFPSCGVMPVWKNTKNLLDHYYDHITLDMMVKNQIKPVEPASVFQGPDRARRPYER